MRKLTAISLIESLIYLAVFSIFFLSVIGFLVSMSDINKSAREKQQLESSTMFVSTHLSNQFQNAQTLTTDGNSFTLTVNSIDYDYSVVEGVFTVTSLGASEPLTPSFAQVSGLVVSPITEGVADIGVDVVITLESKNDSKSTRAIDLTLLLGSI